MSKAGNILHYCLIPNHLHLLIQVKEAKDLPKFMQGVLQSYAYYFRKRYDTAGYVLRKRPCENIVDEFFKIR